MNKAALIKVVNKKIATKNDAISNYKLNEL